VVELQRQVINLTAKLRIKAEVADENVQLKTELADFKAKFFDSQKKYLQTNE